MTSSLGTDTLLFLLQNLDYIQNSVFTCSTLTLVMDFYLEKIKVTVVKSSA